MAKKSNKTAAIVVVLIVVALLLIGPITRMFSRPTTTVPPSGGLGGLFGSLGNSIAGIFGGSSGSSGGLFGGLFGNSGQGTISNTSADDYTDPWDTAYWSQDQWDLWYSLGGADDYSQNI